MVPGPRSKCDTPSCRRTREKPITPSPWHCPACVQRRRHSLRITATHPSTVRRAQQEGLSVGEYCRRLKG